jgi:hypothetical protein
MKTQDETTLSHVWWTGFLKRHPNIVYRTPQTCTKASSTVSWSNITAWEDNINNYLDKNQLTHNKDDARRWYNCDEIGFDYNPQPKKVLAKKGAKQVILNFKSYQQRIKLIYLVGFVG